MCLVICVRFSGANDYTLSDGERSLLTLCARLDPAGSINTIFTKYQDLTPVGSDAKGRELFFKHPAVQSAFMFLGESLCLVFFFIHSWSKAGPKEWQPRRGFHAETTAHKLKTLLTFGLPHPL